MEINPDIKPNIRDSEYLKNVFFDKSYDKKEELYYVYRGIKEENETRYDITKIFPKMLGKEFSKTKGHYHCGEFQEIYIVLEGEAIFLAQKGGDEIEDVFFVKAKKGEVAVIPYGYGHITINPSQTETLEIANWVNKECKNDYSLISEKEGACYFYTTEGWIKNPNYSFVPEIREEFPLKEVPENKCELCQRKCS